MFTIFVLYYCNSKFTIFIFYHSINILKGNKRLIEYEIIFNFKYSNTGRSLVLIVISGKRSVGHFSSNIKKKKYF